MNVLNVHERTLLTSDDDTWRLIANLGSKHDLLWPEHWPKMRFDRPLGLGAHGGHGPIGYYVERFTRPELIRFRFTAPKGFEGYHEFQIEPRLGSVIFRHTLRVRTRGLATWFWLLVLRPLHDALVEDAMDRASNYSSGCCFTSPWSLRVRLIKWLMGAFSRRRKEVRAAAPMGNPR